MTHQSLYMYMYIHVLSLYFRKSFQSKRVDPQRTMFGFNSSPREATAASRKSPVQVCIVLQIVKFQLHFVCLSFLSVFVSLPPSPLSEASSGERGGRRGFRDIHQTRNTIQH